MNPDLRELLVACDDPRGCEAPARMGRREKKKLIASVDAIQASLNEQFGISLEKDGWVQDASFFEELRVRRRVEDIPGVSHAPEIAIRFSSFGKLYTLFTSLDEFPPQYPVEKIHDVIQQHGWRFVDGEVLEVPYDGVNQSLRDWGVTWWVRYFDYL